MSATALIPPSILPLLTLSYPLPTPHGAPTLYSKGPLDLYFVAFSALGFTVLREGVVRLLLCPLARAWVPAPELPEDNDRGSNSVGGGSGVAEKERQKILDRKKEHMVMRFAEQAWSFLYCTVFWTMGMVILLRIPDRLSPEQLWGTYPYTPIPGLTKFYYLAQLGWWFHQVYVVNTEKRRKDHWQMFGHHILTIALLTTSYVANFTRVGTVTHALMDLCDIFFPLAKLLRYMSFTTACDCAFVVFLLAWVVTRQVGLFLVIKSVYYDLPRFVPFDWAPEKGRFLTYHTHLGFVVMLSILFVLCTVWFYMAMRVAVRVVRGQGAEDSRSDSDVDEERLPLDDVADVVDAAANGVHSNGVLPAGKPVDSTYTNGHSHTAIHEHNNGIKRRK